MLQSAGSASATSEPCNQLSLTVAPVGSALPRLTLSGSCGATSFTALGSGSVTGDLLHWQTDYIGTLTLLPQPNGGACSAFRVNAVSLRSTSASTATLMYSVVVCDGAREGTATVTRSP
jgi:hypothetical protein